MRLFLRIAVITYLAYLALALLIVSPALNLLPHRYLQDNYGWGLETGWVLLNPFTLSLDISEAEVTDPAGEEVLSFSRGSVNLSLASLWRPGWVLDAFSIQNIFLGVTRISEEEYNFSSLLPAEEPAEPAEKDSGGIPGITIHDLDIHSDSIVLNDEARRKAYSSRWEGLHIRATELSTVIEEGKPYTIDLQGDGGGMLHWRGEVSLPRGTSAGELSISNLNLRKLWEFAEPWLTFELREGRLEIEGDYEIDWSEDLHYKVSEGHFGLSSIDITPLNVEELPDTTAKLENLAIDGINLESDAQAVTISALTVDGLALAAWMAESQVSLVRMFTPPASGEEEEPAAEDAAEDSGWSVSLAKIQLRDSSLDWRSRYTEPAVLEIRPIEASIDNLAWPFSGETGLSLELSVNGQASIGIGGALALEEGAGTITYQLESLPLAWFDPNLPVALKATIDSGQANVEGSVTLSEFSPVTMALDGAIREFAAHMEADGGQFTGLESFRFDGLQVNMEERDVVLEKIAIDGFVGRVHIKEDGSINASNIWKEEMGERAEEVADDLAGDEPWDFALQSIGITGSEVDFMDESLPLHFRTVIGEIEGEVRGISSAPGAVAEVEIEGSVDEYAPVSLQGTLSPFADPLALDLDLSFDSVDMATLSPYSGNYAGYAIDRGLLDLDLEYRLENNQLQGRNAIRIDKLKLGEKVDSDEAVDLPLELALAILTDANGVIDMQIPISGDVDKPDFELGSVIAGALFNTITKIVTSPFKMLAGLADSEEDLQRLTYSPGSSRLGKQNRDKLDALAAALEQRPRLSLVITGRVNVEQDRERLQKKALESQLLEQGLTEEDIEAKGERWEEAVGERYGDLPAAGEDAAPTLREQYVSVYSAIDIPDDALTELAQERAVNAKGYLVNTAGMAPDRAVLGQPSLDDEDNSFSGVELGLEN